MKNPARRLALLLSLLSLSGALWAAETTSQDQALAALEKAVAFFRNEVGIDGGYLWRYSADLARREGEGKATETIAWVQPPGTPSIGSAYLEAYQWTGQAFLLEAALETARALVRGQLRSGGWGYNIEFDPEHRTEFAYRTDPPRAETWNTTTLDDDTTQAVLQFLMRLDKELKFTDASIHEAVQFGLEALLAAQYPNGAWPQRFDAPPTPGRYPVKKAEYPESWSPVFPNIDYRDYYTFNDSTIADSIAVMFDAAAIYDDLRYRAAAEKAGDFILLAQMPDPQPAWAQQYDAEMHPAWARKFEPPAVTGGESQGVMRTLMEIYRCTGNPKYLEPLPRALAYLKASRLPDGRLARFYELKTNTPLYFTKDYHLTYTSDDMPTHYAFIVASHLDEIEAQYESLRAAAPAAIRPSLEAEPGPMTSELAQEVARIIQEMDDRGAWVEEGNLRYHGDDDPTDRIIDCRTFAHRLRTLARFIAASP